jgi:hypothetical protein
MISAVRMRASPRARCSDRVYSDPECDGTRHLLLENTTDWYGQDKHGNVWYFGEATVEYSYDRNGHRIDADTEGSWEAGRDGALAGIVMLAVPVPGFFYRQEYIARRGRRRSARGEGQHPCVDRARQFHWLHRDTGNDHAGAR